MISSVRPALQSISGDTILTLLTSDCMLDLYSRVYLEKDPLVRARVDEELEGTKSRILQMPSHLHRSLQQWLNCCARQC